MAGTQRRIIVPRVVERVARVNDGDAVDRSAEGDVEITARGVLADDDGSPLGGGDREVGVGTVEPWPPLVL